MVRLSYQCSASSGDRLGIGYDAPCILHERPMNIVKSFVFLLIAPGTVLVGIPYLLIGQGQEEMRLPVGPLRGLWLPLGIVGFAGLLRCFWDFATQGRGTPAPIDPPKELVVRGLYRVFRNPMYTMILMVLFAEVLFFSSVRILVWAGLVWLVFHLVVVLYEEPGLKKRFGESYETFLHTTPRWLPKHGPDARAFHRDTFGHVVALIYTAGGSFQIYRSIYGFDLNDMPYEMDWVIMVLGTYGGIGLLRFAREIDYRGVWEKVIHWLIVIHLLGSVVIHAWMVGARSHGFLEVFPIEYSYFAVAYFGVFAWRMWRVRLKRTLVVE